MTYQAIAGPSMDHHHLHLVTPAGRRLTYQMHPEGRFLLEDGRDLDAVLDEHAALKAKETIL